MILAELQPFTWMFQHVRFRSTPNTVLIHEADFMCGKTTMWSRVCFWRLSSNDFSIVTTL